MEETEAQNRTPFGAVKVPCLFKVIIVVRNAGYPGPVIPEILRKLQK